MRIVWMLLAAAALVALTAAPAAADRDLQAPGGFAYQNTEFQAQADANHLSPEQARSLQARVDQVIARTAGTQVAINQVAWDGGDTLIPLPGEERARELGVAPSGAIHGCHYTQFCTYENRNYTGMIDQMVSCTLHRTNSWADGRIIAEYMNNQTPGTVAKFYTSTGSYLWSTHPALASGAVPFVIALFGEYIRPC